MDQTNNIGLGITSACRIGLSDVQHIQILNTCVHCRNVLTVPFLARFLQSGYNQSDDELAKPLTGKRRSSSRFYNDSEPRHFSCTACGMLLKNREVMKHPSLDVGICRKCKNFLFSGPFNKVNRLTILVSIFR